MTTETTTQHASTPVLILFVTGDAPRSRRARANLASMLERLGRSDLSPQEIDLLDQPQAGLSYAVFATPSLLKREPGRDGALLYGDLSDSDRLERFLADLMVHEAEAG
ncbi:hypothetical protein A6K26_003760 [Gammaproteobacteria bacterium 2W06]|nr:hypothetical protein A6K26_003760 [Gammaproteobacteria bacterium 2W06]